MYPWAETEAEFLWLNSKIHLDSLEEEIENISVIPKFYKEVTCHHNDFAF